MAKNSSEGRQTIKATYGPEYEVFAAIIKKHRKKAGMTQWTLSEMVGRSKSYVGKIESGHVFPDFMTGIDLLRSLGLEPADVIAQIQAETKKKRKG